MKELREILRDVSIGEAAEAAGFGLFLVAVIFAINIFGWVLGV